MIASMCFLAEGAGTETIIAEMEAAGEDVPRDAFGHAKLDAVNPGAWYAARLKEITGAEKGLGAEEWLLCPCCCGKPR